MARVSDDFYPTDSASWTSHIPICSYNSLFMGALIQVSSSQEQVKISAELICLLLYLFRWLIVGKTGGAWFVSANC